ncbi:uncharacterized protein LOC110431300 [Sorghum bicolor]|uniref:uncharacterized protein LOC110431300 n=1 Tax=Sorghum bicolor TaxID=4558 RepID=UPI000B426A8D|nr:uncharacterized protein LOC110431300 [Sorghum bicolor]|eukprot:XP_021305957.1 uncharacterized protein LOC110431300 [Sorghum bicolor]
MLAARTRPGSGKRPSGSRARAAGSRPRRAGAAPGRRPRWCPRATSRVALGRARAYAVSGWGRDGGARPRFEGGRAGGWSSPVLTPGRVEPGSCALGRARRGYFVCLQDGSRSDLLAFGAAVAHSHLQNGGLQELSGRDSSM